MIAIVMVSVFSLYTHADVAQHVTDQKYRLTKAVELLERNLSRTFDVADAVVRQFTRAGAAWTGSMDSFAAVHGPDFARQILALPTLESAVVADASGTVLFGTRSQSRGVSVARHPFFQVHRHRGHRGMFVGKPSVERRTGNPVIPLSWPLVGPHGEFTGVLAVDMNTRQLSALLERGRPSPQAIVTLHDRDGAVYLAEGVGVEQPAWEVAAQPVLRMLHAGGPDSVEQWGGSFLDRAPTNWYVATRTLHHLDGLGVAAAVPEAEVLAESRSRSVLLGTFLGGMLLAMGLIAWLLCQAVEAQAAAEADLAESRNQLAVLNRQKDKLFSVIAQDLRSSIHNVVGYCDLLGRESPGMSRADMELYAGCAADGARELCEHLENVLRWADVQMNHVTVRPAAFSLCEAVAEVLSVVGPAAAAKGIVLRNGVVDGVVVCDRDILSALLRNLIGNAVKYTDTDGTVTVTGGVLPDGLPAAEIVVRDSGVGMTAGQIGCLFQLDRLAPTRGTRGETGCGLGLHLCKALVDRIGGTIAVDSAPDRGTTVRILLPTAGDGAASPGAEPLIGLGQVAA